MSVVSHVFKISSNLKIPKHAPGIIALSYLVYFNKKSKC